MPEGLGCASFTSAEDSLTFGRAQTNGKCVHVKYIFYPNTWKLHMPLTLNTDHGFTFEPYLLQFTVKRGFF